MLSAAVLARIHELNLDYLELLAAEHNGGGVINGQLQHLPCKLHATIAGLVAVGAHGRWPALPYTLYSLGFEDEKLWRSLAEPARWRPSLSLSERYAQPHSFIAASVAVRSRAAVRVARRNREPAGSASHLRDAGGRHAALDCGAAVVRQASRRASRFVADAALADEPGLLAGSRALRRSRGSTAAGDSEGARQPADRSGAARTGVAVAAPAGASARLTIAE